MRRTIRVPALVAAILAFSAVFGGLEAQVPTLNPEQTTNPATGSMGFSLPLGVVQGINGHDFPVSLNYQAGIQIHQEASPAGLGFSYGAGAITRKVVLVPDCNKGGVANYYSEPFAGPGNSGCDVHTWWETEWGKIAKMAIIFSSLMFAIVTGGASSGLAMLLAYGGAMQSFLSTPNTSFSIPYSPKDYIAGGDHTPVYKPPVSMNTQYFGRGFLRGTGGEYDLPDVYLVNTPYVSGEFVWMGGTTDGHFILRQTSSCSTQEKEAVRIYHDFTADDDEKFRLVLQDGTQLFFEMTHATTSQTYTEYSHKDGNVECMAWSNSKNIQKTIDTWYLTKVLFNDFDGNADAPSSGKGSWITFDYDKRTFTNVRQLPSQLQSGYTTTTRYGMCHGDPTAGILEDIYLMGINTPNQYVRFRYKGRVTDGGGNVVDIGRKDDLWFNADHVTWHAAERNLPSTCKSGFCVDGIGAMPVERKVLDAMDFYTKGDKQFKRVAFTTSYTLRQKSYNSYLIMSDRLHINSATNSGCLTLNSVSFMPSELSTSSKYEVKFLYNYNLAMIDANAYDWTIPQGQIAQKSTYCFGEPKDLWGYYIPRMAFEAFNDFNPNGDEWRGMDPTDNSRPTASVWSLDSMIFSTGMSLKWVYEQHRYDKANGVAVTSNSSATPPPPKFGGGIRVKKIRCYNDLDKTKPKTWSYFYRSSATPGNFLSSPDVEPTEKSSGYISVEPNNYIAENDIRDNRVKGGLYTPSTIAYEKVEVVSDIKGTTAPYGYKIYEFTHAGDQAIAGFEPNNGRYGDIDCSWKRGHLRSVSVHDRTGKTIDSTFNGYSFVSESEADISYPDIEDHSLGTRGYYYEGTGSYYAKMQNGFIDFGWTRLDSVVNFHDGVRKKTGNTYCDGNPASKDYTSRLCPRSCMAYSAGSPGLTWNGNPCAIKTAAIRGTGAEADKITIFAARGELGGMGADINFQAISNVDVTDGTVDFSNARWSNNASFFLSNSSGSWLLTGLDAIDYNDNGYKNDLLFQFTDGYSIKLVVLPNVQVISGGSTISHDPMIQLRVVHSGSPYPLFRTNCTFPYIDPANLGSNTNCSAVCNLVSGSAIDMVFYCFDKDHTCLNNENPLFILQDVVLTDNTPFPGDDPGVKKAPYNEEQSIMTCTGIKDEHNTYPVIGPHAKFLALDGGLQNDMVTAALIPGIISADTRIHDVVIENLSVNPADRTISYTGLDPTLGQTTVVANVDQYNWRSSYNSATNFFGLVAPDDLSWRIHIFQIPAGAGVYKTLLYGSYKETVVGDLDGQPNEVWTTAPNDKYLVTKAIPAYWKYPEMKIPHMLTQSCQTITYEKVAATPLSDADTKAAQATTWSNNRLYSPGPLGSILREYWTDIGSSNLVSALTSHPDFIANKASGAEFLPSFECPQNWADNYGQRVRGYVCPPQSGTYYFFLLSDDYSELWLSTDDNPANKRLIGSVTMQLSDGWGNARMSEGVTLVAGKYYYIEGLHKEADQVDFFKIGWILPDGTMTERPIPGNRLAPVTFNWLPSQTYAWNVPKNHAGVPLTTFSEFNFTTPPSQPNVWQLTGGVEKYDAFSAPLETKNAKGISSTTVYRNDVHLPIASIANANYKECGVFTGDYHSGENAAYWDYSNGWMMGTPAQGGSVSLVSDAHFGEKVIKVRNNYAAGRNNVIIPGKSYRMTAWVKVETGKMLMAAGFHYVTGGTWPEVTLSTGDDGKAISADEVSTVGQWRLMRLDIPGSWTANFDASKTLVARAWVGNPKIAGSVGYVDDVRFRPVKSLVTSTYYDSKWQQPILSVDANNHPGRKVAYDDFGRPTEWWKIDAINPYLPKIVEEKCYHLMNEVTDDLFNPESYYKIVSVVDETKCIDIAGPVYANGQPVHMYTYAGNDNQQWKIVADGCGCYSILSLHDESFGIDDPDFNIANRTELRIWTAKGPAQKWRLIPNGDGTYKIASKANRSVVIDVRGGDDGTVANDDIVQLYADWNGPNQKWKIENVTP